MKYLKRFEKIQEYESYKNGSDYVLPNVSYVKETKGMAYEPKKAFTLRAKYEATPDNLVAFTSATNIKSLTVNGTSVKFEPLKNEISTFDVLGENILINMETGEATFPESYLIKSPVSSWSFKAKDSNYTINENTYVCLLIMMDGMAMVQPTPFDEIRDYALTTNDGVTLEAVDEFLAEMNMQIQSGMQIGFTLIDVDMDNETFVFIDTEHQTIVTTGGLSTYSFDSEGLYDVKIEISDPAIKMLFAETQLTSIEIGNDITSICDNAFYDCRKLTRVTIGTGVTTIGDSTFENCSELTSIVVSSGNTKYDSRENCNCLIETETNKLVKGCNNSVIPDSVTTIGHAAFHFCFSLTSITIPDSVTEIGNYAFYNCKNLASVTIGDSVTTIGREVFAHCSSLNEIICKGNIAPQIQNTTFGNSYNPIKKFGVLKVPDNADYSSWMSAIGDYGWTSSNSPVYDVICTYNVDNISNSTNLYTSTGFKPSMMIINDEKLEASSNYQFNEVGQYEIVYRFLTPITEINAETFKDCTNLTSITIPNSVTTIGNKTFYNCSNLTSVDIPNSVEMIGQRVFYSCPSLTSVNIPNGVTTIGEATFQNCSSLASITIPDNVTSIEDYAFQNCEKFTSITIPDGVNLIGSRAFCGCSNLTSITIPDSVTNIEWYAFKDCSSLTSVYINDIAAWCNIPFDDDSSNPLYNGCNLYLNNKLVTDLVIPDSVISIGYCTFKNCTSLTSVTIPDSVTTIGHAAFNSCSSLESVTIGNGVMEIGNMVFNGCNNLANVTIGDNVTSIGSGAFQNCISLENISIPDSVTTLGKSTFYGCSSLTSVTIGNSVTSIGQDVFYKCSNLESVNIPDSVIEIGDYAFHSCSRLTNATIGDGLNKIGNYVFYGCSELTSITCYAPTAPSIQSSTFNKVSNGGTLYVPTGSDYIAWMSTSSSYLGYQNWTIQYI